MATYEKSGNIEAGGEHERKYSNANPENLHDTMKTEAIGIFGDVETAEQYGYVSRGLKSRHIQFIALGGTIGTGLFVGIGGALSKAGPLSTLLGYTFTGFAIFCMMQCLGEMATWLPLPGAIPQMCSRYYDDALGFAVGWNQWYNCATTLCVEISAAALVIGFWPNDINIAVWISLIIVLVIILNIFAVSIYGEAEFIFASIKLVTIVGLLILALVLDLGGGPKHQRLGFQYWKNPGAMKAYIGSGAWGRFLGVVSTLVQAAFSYGGVEMVAVAAGEAENPRKNIPKAVRRVFWRILFFYVLGSLAVGLLVPYDDEFLLRDGAPAARSPWVIAIDRAGIKVLPSIINAVILTSASSSANAFCYTGSRYLYALAQSRQAPQFLLKCNKKGVPIYCVGITAAVSLLTFMTLSEGGSNVFLWFSSLVTTANLFTWCCISVAYIKFKKALEAQGVDRDTLVFKSPFQPFAAWFALIYFSFILIFSNFSVFTKGKFNVTDFLTSYIGIPIFFIFFFGWKLIKRTKPHKASEVDLYTGKAAIDAEVWPDQVPRNMLEKIWFWIA
jgi:amino acid transporter